MYSQNCQMLAFLHICIIAQPLSRFLLENLFNLNAFIACIIGRNARAFKFDFIKENR